MSEIRSGDMCVARSIFAKQNLFCESKNTYLADLPPGSPEGARGKSVRGVPAGGCKHPPASTTYSFQAFSGVQASAVVEQMPVSWTPGCA